MSFKCYKNDAKIRPIPANTRRQNNVGTNKLAVSCSYEYINLDTGDSREIPMMH